MINDFLCYVIRTGDPTGHYLQRNRHQQLMPNRQVVSILHASLIERHINVVAPAAAAAHVVEVRLAKVRPERTVLVSVDREVEDSGMVGDTQTSDIYGIVGKGKYQTIEEW